jgi:hypothetical protein
VWWSETEFVNPRLLVPYREHSWSRGRNREGVEAWDALRADVAENGFREPAVLEYNHATGQGYIGEGNHRIGIALELGVPVPLVVYRTTKTAPAFPMRPITEPGKYSMRDERGFPQFRELMRPSDIGLPTVTPTFDRLLESETTSASVAPEASRKHVPQPHKQERGIDAGGPDGGIEI